MKIFPVRSALVSGGVIAGVLAFGAAAPAMADDTTGPTASNLAIYGIAGGDPGYIKQNAAAYVCATGISDSGSPASGFKSATADISSFGLSNGVGMNGPTWTGANGYTYDLTQMAMYNSYDNGGYCQPFTDPTAEEVDWRTQNVLAEGVYPWSVTLKDNAGNSNTQSSTVIVDNTPPKAIDVKATDGGGTVGKPQQGDKVTLTYSEVMNRFLADETARNVTVHIDNSGTNDVLSVWSYPWNNAQNQYVGTVKLGGDYVSANRTFGVTGTPSKMIRSGSQVIITLGTASGSTNTVTGGSHTMVFTPGGSDRAGNPVVKTPPLSKTGGPGF